MQHRPLGPNGPKVSSLGIGAMSFADFYGPTDEAESHAIMDAALDAGVDHLDTSNVYGMGKSESAIGTYLNRYRVTSGIPFRIATKASITKDPDTGKRMFNNTPDHLEAELDQSLKRLGVDCVDLFYIHRRDPRFEIEEVVETLVALIAKGKIKSFGFSEIAPTSLERAAAIHPVAAVQSEYSLQTRQPELGVVQACERLGTAMVAFSPLGRGMLTDRPHTPERIKDMPFLRDNPRFTGENLTCNIAASQPLRDLARDMGQSTSALAIAWVLAQSPSVLAIPGTRSVAHFRELVAGANLTLSDSDLAEINRRLPPGWAHGHRYNDDQMTGPENYC